ncbi:MAG TPA: sulfurtransferase TusA family protein [Pararhizobium sp.]|uniref:sulfurtransferase TusA family protein n=1 Tax=Pararhizobium sp. TaxID=1977563 RepID=UPI002B51BC59|nr:sulfurtransferase TusA family protein [Pararhizobium sp.]HTO32182.1 sulfurtransferase TusA family protein [Pararhizobium sp.]
MPEETSLIYDLKGLKCPLPVLRTRKRMLTLSPGTLITVETTDPLAIIDIPHFCNEDGHSLERSETLATGHRFVIRKA